MRVIGVTGTIGSGKTYLCKRFQEDYNIPVFYFDLEARLIIESDKFVISELKRFYGKDIFLNNSIIKLNTKKLADIIFTDEVERLRVERLIRGPLMDRFYRFIYLKANTEEHSFILAESATLMTTKMYKLMDEVLLVEADLDKSLEKLEKERNISSSEAKRRMNLQVGTLESRRILDSENISSDLFINDFTDENLDEFVFYYYNAEMRIGDMIKEEK